MADSKKPGHLLLKMLALAALVLVSYLALLYGVLAIDRKDNYFVANSDKLRLLKETPHPKVVLIGGSNLAFGTDSARLSEALGVPVVNMGVTVDFGLKMMLDQVDPYLQQGDVVVVVPEYEHFCGDTFYGTGVGLFELAALNETPAKLNALQAVAVARAAMKETPRVLGYKPAKLHPTSDPAAVVFTRSSFNRYGDVTTHLNLPGRKIPEYPLDTDLNDAAVQYLHDFATANDRRGVTTVVLYPPLQKSYYLRHAAQLQVIAAALRGKAVPVSSAPQDFVYDDRLFFDCIYHLNAEGRALRTEKMIQILAKTLPPRQREPQTATLSQRR